MLTPSPGCNQSRRIPALRRCSEHRNSELGHRRTPGTRDMTRPRHTDSDQGGAAGTKLQKYFITFKNCPFISHTEKHNSYLHIIFLDKNIVEIARQVSQQAGLVAASPCLILLIYMSRVTAWAARQGGVQAGYQCHSPGHWPSPAIPG